MTFLRPTLKDVAKLSGVSEISVSRVMRNAPNISSRLRNKVEAAALELHYTPNKIAGALASNTTDLIGVVVPTLKNIEYTQILSGIESVLGQSKYRMMLGISDFSEQRETKIVRDFLAWNPSGIIMAGGSHSDDVSQLLERSKASFVEIINDERSSMNFGLGISYDKAAADLVSYWLKQGHNRVTYVGTSNEQFFPGSFKSALFKRLRDAGINLAYQLETDELTSITLGMKICSEIVQQAPRVDAVFFEDGNLAVGASFYCSMMAPDAIAIASFNNSPHIDDSRAVIDLINIPFHSIGVDAAKFFFNSSNIDASVNSKRTILPAEFIKSAY